MKRLFPTSITLLIAIISIAITLQATAQEWAELRNDMIETTYVLPRNPANMPSYVIFKDQQVLEELSAFLSPLRLPKKLSIKMTECGYVNLYYAPGQGVTICYEFPRALWRFASEIGTLEGFTRRDVFVGTFVLFALHEMGHAVFDFLKVPVFGRQEDAADQIAALVMLNFGDEFARRNLNGAARFLRAMDRPMSRTAYADEHGSLAQRFYNLLCIAYGAQPETFKSVVEEGILPKERAAHCDREYRQVEFAFTETIRPHVDEELFKKVKSIRWASWEREIKPTSHLPGIFLFLVLILGWGAMIALLIAKMSSSGKDVFRQMTTIGLSAFRGRLDRIHWWAYMLSAGLIAFVLIFALGFFQVDFASPRPLRVTHALLGWTIAIVLYYWQTTFVIRRLHDRNRGGWLTVFWLAPPMLTALIATFPILQESSFVMWSYVVSFWLLLWILIEVGFLRGTQEKNRYGYPEKGYGQISVAAPAVSLTQRFSIAWLVAGPVMILLLVIAAIMLLAALLGS